MIRKVCLVIWEVGGVCDSGWELYLVISKVYLVMIRKVCS